jgi:hypothetical protein
MTIYTSIFIIIISAYATYVGKRHQKASTEMRHRVSEMRVERAFIWSEKHEEIC